MNKRQRRILQIHHRVLKTVVRQLVKTYLKNRGTENEFVGAGTPPRGGTTHQLWKIADMLTEDENLQEIGEDEADEWGRW